MYNNLRAELARLNLSNKDLARELRVTHKTILNKMNERSEFTLKEIMQIMKIVNINDIDYLFVTDKTT